MKILENETRRREARNYRPPRRNRLLRPRFQRARSPGKDGCSVPSRRRERALFQGASTGERPFLDVLSDRRFWLIHSPAVSSLFLGGAFSAAVGLGDPAAPRGGRPGAGSLPLLLADRLLGAQLYDGHLQRNALSSRRSSKRRRRRLRLGAPLELSYSAIHGAAVKKAEPHSLPLTVPGPRVRVVIFRLRASTYSFLFFFRNTL